MRSLKFLAIVFALSWLCWIPGLLVSHFSIDISKEIYLPLAILGTLIPSIVGIVFMKKSGQKILKRLSFKLGKWWFPMFLIFPVGGFLAQFSFFIIDGGNFSYPENFLIILVQFFMIMIIMGPLGEEFGWRGVYLPELQKKYNALVSSVITGLVWTFWHLPLFFINDAPQSKLPFFPFLITLVLASILITWIQNNANQNLWPAIVIHTMINLTSEIFVLIDIDTGEYKPWIYANIILALFTIVIIATYGSKKLSKN